MKVCEDIKLDFSDVLILPKNSELNSRSEVELNNLQGYTGEDIVPIMTSNMDTTGTFEMFDEFYKNKLFTCIHKHYNLDEWKSFFERYENDENIYNYFCVSIGTSENDFSKLEQVNKLSNGRIEYIMIDVANGYCSSFLQRVKNIKNVYHSKILMAGNVVTGERTKELIKNGVDVVKIGIGSGSVCTTRLKSGVGFPQFSAVLECAEAAHECGGRIISDGGITCPGDIVKAFGAGADFVMLGSMLAGHDESGGNLVEVDNVKYKEFYGMSSATAMKKYNGGVANYRSSEGKRVLTKYKGPVSETIKDFLGGIRSACTYTNSKNISELKNNCNFIKVNNQVNNIYK